VPSIREERHALGRTTPTNLPIGLAHPYRAGFGGGFPFSLSAFGPCFLVDERAPVGGQDQRGLFGQDRNRFASLGIEIGFLGVSLLAY